MRIRKVKPLAGLAFSAAVLFGCAGPEPVAVVPASAPVAGPALDVPPRAAAPASPPEGISILPQSQAARETPPQAQPRPARSNSRYQPAHPFSAASSAVVLNIPLGKRRSTRHSKHSAHAPAPPSTSQATTDSQSKESK